MSTSPVADRGAGENRALPRIGRAAVVAARDLAAQAGATILSAGGNAADAAVATASALAVVDPANCGIGGFGGFAVLDHGDGRGAAQIAFNARVPQAYRPQDDTAGRPGIWVSPPAVVGGLSALHARFGRLKAAQVWAPAVRLAREGFAVGKDLASALRWAKDKHRGLNAAFRHGFFRDGEPLQEGAILVQTRLAETLERVAAEGSAAMKSGPIVASICRTAGEAGGCLAAEDFRLLEAQVEDAARCQYEDATIWAPDPEQCGVSVLFGALAALDGPSLGESRSEQYVEAMAAALGTAWRSRNAAYAMPSRPRSQTTHLCAADETGMLVSMTFTHGPAWFGSGLLDEASGIVLNTGARIFSRRLRDGALVAKPHLTPIVVHHRNARYAIGSPGGQHIPAIVFQAVVDVVHYRTRAELVLGGPRMSADSDGNVQAEPEFLAAFRRRGSRSIGVSEYYGPASMIARSEGAVTAFRDPRFEGACAQMD